MTLEEIKKRWNEVLDEILRENRILWLAVFDARLANYSDGILTLDFSDPAKFGNEHDFAQVRNQKRIAEIEKIARKVLGVSLTIHIDSGK